MTTTTSRWYEQTQGRTLNEATSHRERWTTDDLEFVVAFTEESSDEELALTLGRSLASIWNIQYRIRSEGVEGVRADVARAMARRAAAARPEVGYDFVTTFPVGWND